MITPLNPNRPRNQPRSNSRFAVTGTPAKSVNAGMTAAALFHLGLVNYQLGRMTNNKPLVLEAAKFSDRAATMKSPYAQQAWRNAHAMRTEAQAMH